MAVAIFDYPHTFAGVCIAHVLMVISRLCAPFKAISTLILILNIRLSTESVRINALHENSADIG